MSAPLPAMETTDERERWIEAFSDAFDNPDSHPLEVAESALRACPDPICMSQLSVDLVEREALSLLEVGA